MIFSRLRSGAQTVMRRMGQPFRSIVFRAREARNNNIVTQSARRVGRLRNRFDYYLEMPRRYLGIGRGSRQKQKTSDKQVSPDDPSSFSEAYAVGSTPQAFQKRFRSKRKDSADPTQDVGLQHMQIHLRDQRSGAHEIVHVGRVPGQIRARHILNGHEVFFTQPLVRGLPKDINVLMESDAPQILVNGNWLDGATLVPKDSTILVDGRKYLVDLQPNLGSVNRAAYVYASWGTHVGPVRSENEDAIGVYTSDLLQMYAVADGVGSGYGGDKMSEFAVKYLLSAVNMNYERDIAWGEVFITAIEHINIEVRKFLSKVGQRAGTTLTAVAIDDWTATIAHVGDSRVYLMRDQSLEQLTTDHSEVVPIDDASTQDFIETQVVLSRAVGKADTIDPEVLTLDLEPNDRLLICSDGITTPISDDELAHILDEEPLQTIPEQLLSMINKRRGTDNASVVVIDVMSTPIVTPATIMPKQDRVFTSTQRSAIPYQSLKQISPTKRNEEKSPDDEPSIGCGCFTLGLLVVLFVFLGFWGNGLWVSMTGTGDNASVILDDTMPTETPDTMANAIDGIIGSATAMPVEVTSQAEDEASVIVTIAPSSTIRVDLSGRNATPIPIVTLTPARNLGPTATLRSSP